MANEDTYFVFSAYCALEVSYNIVSFLMYVLSQAGVSPKLIKQHANNLISTDDVNTRS